MPSLSQNRVKANPKDSVLIFMESDFESDFVVASLQILMNAEALPVETVASASTTLTTTNAVATLEHLEQIVKQVGQYVGFPGRLFEFGWIK